MKQQLMWIKQLGMGGVVIHPRPGFKLKFMSEAYLLSVKKAVQMAKTLQLDVWLYDEDSYPSGFAGGLLLERFPQYRARGMRYATESDYGQLPLARIHQAPIHRIFKLDHERDTYQAVFTDEGPGQYVAFFLEYAPDSAKFNGGSYIDTRNPDAVDAFIGIVHEGYEKQLGDEFGKTIKGIYADEPGGYHYLDTEHALNWTEGLERIFQDRYRYDLLDSLPSLVFDTESCHAVRHDYYQLMNDLFARHFTARIDTWCKERGLAFTGHYWEHSWPQIHQVESHMAHYANMELPGMDCLFRPDTLLNGQKNAQMGNILMVKELQSVCRQLGKRRSMCEIWGGAGWDVSMTDLKRMADWLLAYGVNLFVPHLVHDSLAGFRKRDWPPSYGEHLPGSSELKPLFGYMERISSWLSEGRSLARIAVVHPAESIWVHNKPGTENAYTRRAGDRFKAFLRGLASNQIDYDLLDARIAGTHGAIEENRLRIGCASYDTVIIHDSVERMADSLFHLLNDYADRDGSVMVYRSDPSMLRHDDPNLQALTARPNTLLVDGDEDLPGMLQSLQLLQVENEEGQVLSNLVLQTSEADDQMRFFVVNHSSEEVKAAKFTMRCTNDWSGDRNQIVVAVRDEFQQTDDEWTCPIQDGFARWELDLLPYQSVCIAVKPCLTERKRNQIIACCGNGPDRLVVDYVDVLAADPNIAVLDFCDLTIDKHMFNRIDVTQAQKIMTQAHGLPYHFHPIFYERWWKSMDQGKGLSRSPGFRADYSFHVTGELPGLIQLVVEKARQYEVRVNGTPIDQFDKSWLDPDFLYADMTTNLKKGVNLITLLADVASLEHELEAVYVLGDFRVDVDDKQRVYLSSPQPLTPGSIHTQGYPFYHGRIRYEASLIFNKEWGRYKLCLPQWNGLVALASVNEQPLGLSGCPFLQQDITPYLAEGANRLAVDVYVGLRNTLGPLHARERLGMASPWLFNPIDGGRFTYDPCHQLEPAGLEAPFYLEKIK